VKRIFSLFIAFALLIGNFAYAEESYIELKSELFENNSTLETLDLNVKNMAVEVYRADINSKNMQSQLDLLNSLPWPTSSSVTSGMRYVIHVVPEQVRYGLFALENNRDIARVSLSNAMRQMVLGVINAENTYDLAYSKYVFYENEYALAENKYLLGSISRTDLLKAEVKHSETETEMKKAKRSLENIEMSLNNFMGVSLDNNYDLKREIKMENPFKDPEKLANQAIERRFEVLDIQEQIRIQQVIIDFYNYGDYLSIYANWKAVRDAEIKKKELALDLVIAKQQIREEIYSALSEIEIMDYQIVQLEGTLALQQNDLETLRRQYEQGYMTETAFKELEFAIAMIKDNLEILYYSYNSKLYALYYATQLGPAYGGGL
jgi:outer membrane protein TolC